MGHVPSSFIGGGKLALKLLGCYTLFRRTDQVDRQEPFSQRQVRIVEDGPGSHGVLIAAIPTAVKMPIFPGLAFGLKPQHIGASAPNTDRAMGPADALKILNALFFGAELLDDFKDGRRFIHGQTPFPDVCL